MPDACYYALIERDDEGWFVAWIPDLPGVVAGGLTEDEVLHKLSRTARQCLHDMIMAGQPLPIATPVGELPQSDGKRLHRRLLLIIS